MKYPWLNIGTKIFGNWGAGMEPWYGEITHVGMAMVKVEWEGDKNARTYCHPAEIRTDYYTCPEPHPPIGFYVWEGGAA